MDHFQYKNNMLHAENVSLLDVVNEHATPAYVYSSATLERHYGVMRDAFNTHSPLICFAVKANSNVAVLKLLANQGAGADCVSQGEIYRALRAGIAPEKIVFSGVGKTQEELSYALEQGVLQINAESVEELEDISDAAKSLGKTARVAIRVNPDVDAKTNDKISTGRKEDKFGVAWDHVKDTYAKAAALPCVEVTGISCHIGSQLTDLEPFEAAFKKVVNLVKELRELGHNVHHVDLGGGLGIPYGVETPPAPADYATLIETVLGDMKCQLVLEPGRLIAGNAGVLLTRVVRVKRTETRTFVIVDAAMNDLIRPSLYNAHHMLVPLTKDDVETECVDVVGPVCETGDVFARQIMLPKVKQGDVLAFRSAGAYGAVMSSYYNTRPLVPEILVKDSYSALIRARPTLQEIVDREEIPSWLSSKA